MKVSIPLKDIMLAPGKRFDPAEHTEQDVITRIKKLYGVIAQVMNIVIDNGMAHIEFRDATPEKHKEATSKLHKGIEEARKGQFLKAVNLFKEVLAVIPENLDARRNMARAYPVDGLREALVNAVAHRQYEDAGRKILLEVFADRVVLSSPGLPPKPITLASLRRGKYRPCSRNPVLAQCLSYFHRIEERGSGFRRMHDQMLDHGLNPPLLGTDMGYFQVIFQGPGENIERLRVPEKRLLVTMSVETQLNERQKAMAAILVRGESLTSRRCEEDFHITRDTANRDFMVLIKLGLAIKEGKGRATRYVLPVKT